MKLEAKVGAFVASGLILLFMLSTQVNDMAGFDEEGKKINAYITDASGLELKSKVKLNGVEIGYIDDISLVDHKVKLRFFIQEDVQIPVDSSVMVTQDTVLGGKLINISLGSSNENLPDNGALSTVGRLSSFEETSDSVDKAAEEARLFMAELRELIAENRTNLFEAIENFKTMGSEFTQTGETVNERLPDIMKQIDSLTKRFDSVGMTLDEKVPVAMDKFISLEDNLSDVFNKNKEPLNNALVSADKFFNSGEEAFKKVDKLLSNFTKSELQFGMNAHYMLNDTYVKSYVDINYLPNPSTYYMLSVIATEDYTQTDVNGDFVDPKTHDDSEYYVSAQYGKRYDDLLFRAGLIETTGGLGIDYFAMQDNLKITFEVYDFNAENDVRGESAHLKLGVRYRFLKHLEIYTGWDNFINSDADNIYLGFGASFTEDSMKILLGSAAGAAI